MELRSQFLFYLLSTAIFVYFIIIIQFSFK